MASACDAGPWTDKAVTGWREGSEGDGRDHKAAKAIAMVIAMAVRGHYGNGNVAMTGDGMVKQADGPTMPWR